VIEELQRKGDFAKVGVAGALAHAVDRALDPVGAAAHRSDCGSSGEAEIVVAMPVDRHVLSEPGSYLPDEVFGRLGRASADRVDHRDFVGACLNRRAVNVAQIAEIAARAVYGEEVDLLDSRI
jgi:hypothetical protein